MDSHTITQERTTVSPRWNPFDPGYKKDLHGYLDSLREIHDLRTVNGYRIFLDHKHVKFLLDHPNSEVLELPDVLAQKQQLVREKEKAFPHLTDKTKYWLVHKNFSHHEMLRALLTKIWRQQELTVAIDECIAMLVTRLPIGEPFDWMPFAEEIPIYIIGKVMGFPPGDRQKLRYWSKLMTLVQEPFTSMYELATIDRELNEFENYLESHLAEQLKHPTTDHLIGRLCLEIKERDLQWSQMDIISFLSQLFFASIETSVIFFGNAMLEIAAAPGLWQTVREKPAAIPVFTEELLRLVSPLMYTARKMRSGLRLDNGVQLHAGELVFLCLGAANRDPAQFADPHTAQLRQPNQHVSFGYGGHYCFGSRIARVEIAALFKSLADRGLSWEIPPQPLELVKGISFREYKSLIVHFKQQ